MAKKRKDRVLVVEDEQPMQDALAEKFEREGFEIIRAKDGSEEYTVAVRERPDIVLLDILLPKTNGMTTMRRLRQENEWGAKVPIILLTNLTVDEKIIKEIAENEPAYYLVKSDWKINDVVEKVKRCLADVREHEA